MEDKGQEVQESQGEASRESSPANYAIYTLADAWMRAKYKSSYLEALKTAGSQTIRTQKNDADGRAAEIVAPNLKSEYIEEWKTLPSEDKSNFLDWLAKKDDDFRLKYEAFLAEIAPVTPSPTAAQEIEDYQNEEWKKHFMAIEERRKEMEALPKIEDMSEIELRREIVAHINETLGKLAQGPVADGGGALGYGREWDYKKRYDRGIMLPLFCSYVRFTKAYEADEQIGVRLELLGIRETGQMYVHLKPEFDEKAKRVVQMTLEEREDFRKFEELMEAQKEAIGRDGLAPAEHRYYFLPLKDDEPVIVSTESFITRASRANPQVADTWIGEQAITNAKIEDTSQAEPITGLPQTRNATPQDLRDAAAIVREYKNFIKDIIEVTPKDFWGRPGLTE